MRDFIHLAQTHSGSNVLVVNASTPFQNFNERVDFVRKNPGSLNYGHCSSSAPANAPGGRRPATASSW